MIRLDKKNLPSYIYKLNVALVAFFAFWFTAVVAVMVTIGCIYGESVITYGTMIGGFALFFLGLAVFWIADNKLYKRLINERTAELEKEFVEMPYSEAERILKEKGIITDIGFAVGGVFGSEILPFEKCLFGLSFELLKSADIDLWIFIQDNQADVKFNSEKKAKYRLDCALFNFLANSDTEIKNNDEFNLLIRDKKQFATNALKHQKTLHCNLGGYRYN